MVGVDCLVHGVRAGSVPQTGAGRGDVWWWRDRRWSFWSSVVAGLGRSGAVGPATYWWTNLRMRRFGRLFGVSRSAAHRVIDTSGPLLALAPVRKRRIDVIAMVGGILAPARGHRLAALGKNYRYSVNVQVVIDADTRLVIVTGDAHPGNRNDRTVYRDSGIQRDLAGRPPHGRRRLAGQRRGDHVVPQTSGRKRPRGLEARPQRRPPHDPRPRRAHPGQDDVLEESCATIAAPPARSTTRCPESPTYTTSSSPTDPQTPNPPPTTRSATGLHSRAPTQWRSRIELLLPVCPAGRTTDPHHRNADVVADSSRWR
ncbi:hypothetical protein SacxiDRAFT_4116 [Saccharomonospora xinjiangensis XJ-54]|uniref:Uncharacterized protein n=1 Tax=Saccharomonospora xinjiangensis XJ-54 TaxID=882086 RepID=I0V851_9PSEU|nr:hypothetical protein SacxiDRAFT_4116 [Saccharomonospora xinjiangensis XJ-54]